MDWKTSGTPAPMRLLHTPRARYAKAIDGTDKVEEMANRKWVLPVFYCRDHFTPEQRYVFFHHQDLFIAHKNWCSKLPEAKEENCAAEAQDLDHRGARAARGHAARVVGVGERRLRGPSTSKEALEAVENAPKPEDEPPELDSAGPQRGWPSDGDPAAEPATTHGRRGRDGRRGPRWRQRARWSRADVPTRDFTKATQTTRPALA